MRVSPTAGAALLIVLAAACNGEPEPQVIVRGKITYRGVPLSTGIIVFAPDSSRGSRGPLAQAEVEGDGTYHLKTADGPGAIPGWYRVTVVAVGADTAPSGHRFGAPRFLLPDKYRDPEMSGLSREVRAGQENCIDFNLE
jgi:hypothetical protein